MEQQKKLKIGVFGGGRGITMVKMLLEHEKDRAELVAVCDRYEPLLEKVRKEADENGISVACYKEFDSFLKHDMDSVILANYGHEHEPYAVKCMLAGKHVMSEVLPAETLAQSVELIETVEKTGMVYTYAENYCYMPHTFEMWRRYRRGDIGEILEGEGEYLHDIARQWPRLAYGEKDHWRNRAYATFYCTHSLGPLLYITGKKPVKVIGFETPANPENRKVGVSRGSGIEMVVLENGAVLKSMHGWVKREQEGGNLPNYVIYGQKGTMESGRISGQPVLNVYIEGEKTGKGTWEAYDPEFFVEAEEASRDKKGAGHGGSDFYPTHLFIDRILGKPDGKLAIDVYQAVEMGICGILAWKSVLSGNIPIDVPDLRKPEVRDLYRNDNACADPAVAGDQLMPSVSHPLLDIPESVYDHLKELWNAGKDINGDDLPL